MGEEQFGEFPGEVLLGDFWGGEEGEEGEEGGEREKGGGEDLLRREGEEAEGGREDLVGGRRRGEKEGGEEGRGEEAGSEEDWGVEGEEEGEVVDEVSSFLTNHPTTFHTIVPGPSFPIFKSRSTSISSSVSSNKSIPQI